MHVHVTNVHVSIVFLCACTLNRVTCDDQNSIREHACIVTCMHTRTYVSMYGNVIRACMVREILVQLSTDTHNFEKYSRGATKYTRVTRMCASSLN